MSDDVVDLATAWRAEDPDPETCAELDEILPGARAGNPVSLAALRDRFGARLQFGTAGLRGLLGAGPSRMNRVLVRRVAAGLADYLIANAPDATTRGVAISYDGRKNSRIFAEDSARVLAARNIAVHLSHRAWPTPVAAWLVGRLGAAAGVMVTASHNPPEYNGYKVYWDNGAQIIPPHDAGIAAAIDTITGAPPMAELSDAKIATIEEALHDEYVAKVIALRTSAPPKTELRVAYTPLHGVGAASVEAVFAAANVGPLHVVAPQRDPDPAFPTVAFPNPEEQGAMDAVVELGAKIDAELIVANDPDADRLCVAVPDGTVARYRILTGDQVGALLADYLLATSTVAGKRLVSTTIVSSQLLGFLAESTHVDYRETLTGFKWIANAAIDWKARTGGTFVMGYEEALGYTVGELVRDKDGVSAALIFADLVAWTRAHNKSVLEYLADIYRRVGLFVTEQVSWTLPGADGLDKMRQTMDRFRTTPPSEIAGIRIDSTTDLSRGADGLPPADVLVFRLDGGRRVIMRPSGTEPKLKSYYEVRVTVGDESLDAARTRGHNELARLRDAHQSMLKG
jgi:phosphomannomutase